MGDLKGAYNGAARPVWDVNAVNKAWAEMAAKSAQAHDLRSPQQIAKDKEALKGDYTNPDGNTIVNPKTGKNLTKYEQQEQEIRGNEAQKFLDAGKKYFADTIALRKDRGEGMTTQDAVAMIKEMPLSYHAMQAAQSYARGNTYFENGRISAHIPEGYKETPADKALLGNKGRKFTGPDGERADRLEGLKEQLDSTFRGQVIAGESPSLSEKGKKDVIKELGEIGVSPSAFSNIYAATSKYKVPQELAGSMLFEPVQAANAPKSEPAPVPALPSPPVKAPAAAAPASGGPS